MPDNGFDLLVDIEVRPPESHVETVNTIEAKDGGVSPR